MDRLRCIEVFLSVAANGSFTAAAARLNMSRSSVTKHIAALEHSFNAALLVRSTHTVALTEAGTLLVEHGRELLSSFERVQDELRHAQTAVRGVIRVGAPSLFAVLHLQPVIENFLAEHPQTQITVHIDDHRPNLIKAGLDLAFRMAPGFDNSADISVLLARVPQVIVAAPSYVERFGEPQVPQELAAHKCLVHIRHMPVGVWVLNGPDGLVSQPVTGNFRSDHPVLLRNAVVNGMGIAKLALYVVSGEIAAGKLSVLLKDYPVEPAEMRLTFPATARMPVRVRTFMEYVKAVLPQRLEQETRQLPRA